MGFESPPTSTIPKSQNSSKGMPKHKFKIQFLYVQDNRKIETFLLLQFYTFSSSKFSRKQTESQRSCTWSKRRAVLAEISGEKLNKMDQTIEQRNPVRLKER